MRESKNGRPLRADLQVNMALELLSVGGLSNRSVAKATSLPTSLVDILGKEITLPRCEHKKIAKRCDVCRAIDEAHEEDLIRSALAAKILRQSSILGTISKPTGRPALANNIRAKIKDLVVSGFGLSARHIAGIVGVAPASVSKYFNVLGIRTKDRRCGWFGRNRYALMPHVFALGFGSTWSMHANSVPRIARCKTKGCAFPSDGTGTCRYHSHFFEFEWSMDWRGVGYSDIYPTDESPHPLFSVMHGWELAHSSERIISSDADNRAREKISDDWWRENVLQARTPQYAPEASTGNVQHTGTFVLWKGFGKKKIRKSQRNRPAGWHGNHPEQKPVKRYSRESLTDLPVWAPPRRAEADVDLSEEFEFDSVEEFAREDAIESLMADAELSDTFNRGEEEGYGQGPV